MKNFVKALDRGDVFQYLKQIFSKLSDAKLKEGIFVRWRSFKTIVSEFLGNKRVKNYEKLVEQPLQNGLPHVYENTPLALTFKFFPENWKRLATSKEKGSTKTY